jgi:hypothetical protein
MLRKLFFHKHDLMNKALYDFVLDAKNIGLSDKIITEANEYIENNEGGVAFEYICERIDFFELPISTDFYAKVVHIAEQCHFPENEYIFLKKSVDF